MSLEGQLLDRKSLRAVTAKSADWAELAKDCVAFANAMGGRLCEWGLVGQSGRTQATRYFVQPELLRSLAFPAVTTLKRIEDHRLRALVLEDLGRYPWSAFGEIHARIGKEISPRRLRTLLQSQVALEAIQKTGTHKGTRYALPGASL